MAATLQCPGLVAPYSLRDYQVKELTRYGFTKHQIKAFAAILGYRNTRCYRCDGRGCFRCGIGYDVPNIHPTHMAWAKQGPDYAIAKANEKWLKLPSAEVSA